LFDHTQHVPSHCHAANVHHVKLVLHRWRSFLDSRYYILSTPNHHLHLSGHFPGKPEFSSSTYCRRDPLGKTGTGFLWSECHSCHPSQQYQSAGNEAVCERIEISVAYTRDNKISMTTSAQRKVSQHSKVGKTNYGHAQNSATWSIIH